MKKFIFAIALAVMTAFAANAQASLVQESNYESFNAVNIADDFVVKMYAAHKYSVKTIVDERIAPFVESYVKNGALYVYVNRKGFSPELKKQLKLKGAPAPVLEVEIYCPSVNSLTLSENACLQLADPIATPNFTLTVGNKAKVNKINLDCETAEIVVQKNGYANVDVNTSKTLYVTTENSSQAIVKHFGNAISLVSSGSSVQNIDTEVVNINVDVSGGSNIEVGGTASELKVKGIGTSRLTAEKLQADKASVEQSGSSKCHVNVNGPLTVNLTGGAMLTFMGKPEIEVDRIVNSTLIKHDDPRRK